MIAITINNNTMVIAMGAAGTRLWGEDSVGRGAKGTGSLCFCTGVATGTAGVIGSAATADTGAPKTTSHCQHFSFSVTS